VKSIKLRKVLIPILCGFILIAYAIYQYSNPQVVIEWETASELDTAGFDIFRSITPDGPFERITINPVPSTGDPLIGGSYRFKDTQVNANNWYYYQLIEIETSGKQNILGETSAMPRYTGWIEGIAGLICIFLSVFLVKYSTRKQS
jgi:hypothetical protein